MAESRLTVRFDGGIAGEHGPASASRDGGAETVLPASVLAAAGIETVGAAEMFELDPPTAGRGGDWSGRCGVVEIGGPIEREGTELLLVRCGPTGYRVVAPSVGTDRLVYRIALTPGPGTDRGVLAGAMRWVVQKVVVPLAGDIVGTAGEHVVTRWERVRRPTAMRFFTPRSYQTAKAEPAAPGDIGGSRVLVLLHGLNAQSHDRDGLGAMSVELVEELNRHYDHVVAFDHPTLTTSPAENARALGEWLRASRVGRVDLLCHSRGGLVARALLESGDVDRGIEIGSVVFVGTPHRGTPLASASHLGGLVDRLLTLAMFVPDNPATVAVEGVLTVATEMAAHVYDHLDGVRAMRPIGDGADGFFTSLSDHAPDGVRYLAVASDFETIPGSGWWHAWRDQGVDLVFGGLPNDAIVPTLSALQLGSDPGAGFDEMVLFDELDAVVHSSYFGEPMVQSLLGSWLARSATRLPGQLRARVRTTENVRALAQMGPDWSLARKFVDLACLAPPPRRPELQERLQAFGATLWAAATRDDEPRRPTVVLLPGIMGSELRAGERRIWLSPWQLAQGGFDRLALDGGEAVTATQMLCFAYRQLLEHVTRAHDVVEFPYDWRRSADKAADELLALLRKLVEERAAGDGPIHIVAHSMGGLVVRRARQRAADGDATDPFPALGGEVVLLGTPNRGSFATPLALLGRHSLVRNLARLDVRKGRREWLELLWTFPGLLELLPDPEGVALAPDDPAPLGWLYQPDRWPQANEAAALGQALQAASGFHGRLRQADGSGLHVVLGDGLPTPVGVRPLGTDRFEVQVADAGDGTVSVACGTLSGATTWYAHGTSHGDLVRDRKVLSGLDEILSGRSPSLLRPVPYGADRSASVVARSEGRWLGPDEAEVDFDGLLPAGRGTAPVDPSMAWTRRDVMAVAMEAVAGFVAPLDVQEVPALAITVVHGSLEYASHPIIVGHATGNPIAGAEARCDALLAGELSELRLLGNYPDRRGGHLYVPKTRPEHRIEGCVVVALDSTAPLSTGELAEDVCRAVIYFAERRRWERLIRDGDLEAFAADDWLGVSTVALGSEPALTLGLERTVDAVVNGVQRANAILRSRDRPTIRHLEFVERYAFRVERIMWTLQRLQERVNASSVRASRIDLGNRQIVQLYGALEGAPPPRYESGRWEVLSVDAAGGAAPDDPIRRLTYRFARDRAAVSDRPRRVDRRVVAEWLKEAVGRPSRSVELGAVLFEELLPAELKDELARADNLVLQVDAMTADVPWEMLVDRLAGDEPLACRAGLLRQFRTSDLNPRTGAGAAPTALVFGDPPTGLVPLPGARQEAREVADLMRNRQVEDVHLLQFDDPDAEGRSSAARIKEAFRARDNRIIHIAAHGLYRVSGSGDDPGGARVEGGVAIGDGAFLTADDFANLRIAPDLVFLNCCHLGRARVDDRAVAAGLLDAVDHHQAAASIAQRLMEIGVRAVIVAGWTVDDNAGRAFAKLFYQSMLDGLPFGDAVRNARMAVYRQSGSANNTWAAYQCYGDPGFQLTPPSVRSGSGSRAAAWLQLEELYVRAGETTDVDGILDELTAVDDEIARRWPSDGELIAQCALVWADLGHYDTAIERYTLAAESEGDTSLSTVEQLVNLTARQALMLHRRAADEVLERTLLETGRKWAAIMDTLPTTSERHLIGGSFEKRLAVLEPDRWREHVSRAITRYVASATLTKNRSAPEFRSMYGFLNALQLAALVDKGAELVEELITFGWIKRWIKDLTSAPPRGSFWAFVAAADSALTAALVPSSSPLDLAIRATAYRLDGEQASGIEALHRMLGRILDDEEDTAARIAHAYLSVRPGARPRDWNSVVEHVELLRDIADAGCRASATGLASLAQRLHHDQL